MEFCNKTYFTKLIGFSPEIDNINLKFKDETLENEFRKTILQDQNKKFLNSTIFFCVPLIFSLIMSIVNNKEMVKTSYLNLSGVIVDILLSILSRHFHFSYICFQSFRYIRFILVYLNVAISYIFPVNPMSETPLRFAYAFILYNNFIQIYFLDFNYILYTFVILLNSVVIYSSQITRNLGKTFLLPEIILNFFYYYMTYLIKKSELLNKKISFFESYKNFNYIEYINNLVDALDTMIICVQNNEILFLNSFAVKYFDTKKILNKNNKSICKVESKEHEIFLGKKDERNKDIKNFMSSFFDSLILNISSDVNFIENQTLTNILKEIHTKEIYNSNDFQKIGYFKHKSHEESYFEVHARKLRYKEEAIEMLIYDLTHLKQAEVRSIETKYKHKILAKIAHEFKTPLITIISLINRINKFQNNEEFHESIDKYLNSINNLSNYTLYLINDIIQYVSDLINVKLCRTEIKLKDLMEFCYNVLKTLIECNENKSDKIQTFLIVDEGIKDIKIDENRLKQIILNLISNAYKFTVHGYIKLKAKYVEKDKIVVISVKDTGIGIKKEDHHYIFREQTHLNIKEEYNHYGSGLGLSIVKNLSNLLKLGIGFQSEYNKGSKFHITINSLNHSELKKLETINYNSKVLFSNPFNESHFTNIKDFNLTEPNKIYDLEQKVKESDSIITIKKNYSIKKYESYIKLEDEDKDFEITNFNFMIGSNLISNKKYKIVVVDDYKLVRENTISLINLLLTKMNILPESYEIIECSDGIDLLEIVKNDVSNKIKLIITDENMEYLNGSEAVRIIRNLEHRRKIPNYQIISMTAFDDTETKKRIVDSGVNMVLSKPCTKSDLSNILIKVF